MTFVIPSLQVAGREANGLIQTVTVTVGSTFALNTVSPQVAAGTSLILSGALPGVLPDGSLPALLEAGQFTSRTFVVTEAFGPDIVGYRGTINGLAVVVVPEPASIAMLAFGVFGMAAIRRRQA